MKIHKMIQSHCFIQEPIMRFVVDFSTGGLKDQFRIFRAYRIYTTPYRRFQSTYTYNFIYQRLTAIKTVYILYKEKWEKFLPYSDQSRVIKASIKL